MALKDKYLTISEAAKELKVSRQTIYRWIADNKISTEKVGGVILVDKKALRDYERERRAESFENMMDTYTTNYIRQHEGYTDADKIERIKNEKNNMVFLVTRKDGTYEKVSVGSVEVTMKLKVGKAPTGSELFKVDLKDIIKKEYKEPEYRDKRRKKTKE